MIELFGLEEKTYTLNLGPQHPSTHGVLRVLLEMDGSLIVFRAESRIFSSFSTISRRSRTSSSLCM